MKHLSALAFVLLAACASNPPMPEGEAVGEPFAWQRAVPLAEVSADPTAFEGRTLVVDATAEAVCLRAGCWMQVAEEGVVAMVRWETGCGGRYAFPEDAVGRRVMIQGAVHPVELSDEDLEHLREEAGPDATIEPTGFELTASSVLIVDPADDSE